MPSSPAAARTPVTGAAAARTGIAGAAAARMGLAGDAASFSRWSRRRRHDASRRGRCLCHVFCRRDCCARRSQGARGRHFCPRLLLSPGATHTASLPPAGDGCSSCSCSCTSSSSSAADHARLLRLTALPHAPQGLSRFLRCRAAGRQPATAAGPGNTMTECWELYYLEHGIQMDPHVEGSSLHGGIKDALSGTQRMSWYIGHFMIAAEKISRKVLVQSCELHGDGIDS